MLITKFFIAFFALVAIGTAVRAQFKETPPAPYPQNIARDRIRAVLQDVNLDNRQQAIATISGLLVWYRDLIDDELIAAWQRDGKAGMPQVIEALADSRVASDVVEFSWRQRREATFNLNYAPMLGHLMARYPDSAKSFLGDLLGTRGQQTPELSQTEVEAVCRILLDMPDTRTWKKDALQILPHYRRVAESLLAQDMRANDQERRNRTQLWLGDLKWSDAASILPNNMAPAAPPRTNTVAAGTNGQSIPNASGSTALIKPAAPSTGANPIPATASAQNSQSFPSAKKPTTSSGLGVASTAPDPASPSTSGTERISPPVPTFKPDPEYSETARKLLAYGTVTVAVIVDTTGVARDLRVTKSLGYGLDEKAIEAIRKWKFRPALKAGQPVNVHATIEVSFRFLERPTDPFWHPGPIDFALANGIVPPVLTDGKPPKVDEKIFSSGTVALEFTVTSNGSVKDIHAVSGSKSASESPADNLATWKFRPAVKDGEPVQVTGRVSFTQRQPTVSPPSPANVTRNNPLELQATSQNTVPSAPTQAQPPPSTDQAIDGTLRHLAARDLLLQTSSGKVLRFRLLVKTEFRGLDGKPVRDLLMQPGDRIAVHVNPDDVETSTCVIFIKSGTSAERKTASAIVKNALIAIPDSSDFGAHTP
jgi:TonB family protein